MHQINTTFFGYLFLGCFTFYCCFFWSSICFCVCRYFVWTHSQPFKQAFCRWAIHRAPSMPRWITLIPMFCARNVRQLKNLPLLNQVCTEKYIVNSSLSVQVLWVFLCCLLKHWNWHRLHWNLCIQHCVALFWGYSDCLMICLITTRIVLAHNIDRICPCNCNTTFFSSFLA